ncbi:hypothetical protein NPIL_606391, partial [Nephila pilipes]
FENEENNDDDVKYPSFAPPDLQYDSPSEEETNEEASIDPEISTANSVLKQYIFVLQLFQLHLKYLKGKEYVNHQFLLHQHSHQLMFQIFRLRKSLNTREDLTGRAYFQKSLIHFLLHPHA